MIFSLLHATARVPDGWKAAAWEWFVKCDRPNDCEYILGIDERHQSYLGEFLKEEASPIPFRHQSVIVNRKRPCPTDCWNLTAEIATGKFLITVSDDWFPPEHWDTGIIAALPGLNPFDHDYVLDVDNQDNSYPLLPFSLLTRAYYQRLGYLFYPEYFGNMADVEFTEVARRDNVVIDARHLKFEHRDPERGGTWDEIYDRQRNHNREAGLEIYERRKREGFLTGVIEVA